MLLVWYCLISAIYFLLNVIEYLFTRLFKFDKSFFTLFYSLINSLFTPHNLSKTNFDNSNIATIHYKDLYNEFNFFFNNRKFTSLRNFLIFFNFSKLFLNGHYNSNFSFLVYINASNINNSKKIYLDKVFSNLSIGYSNYTYLSNKFYKNYKFLSTVFHTNFVLISDGLRSRITENWNIKYAPSNFLKYINLENLTQYNVLYLRKHKVFNKGRYSRNRQYYRTGVYWCLYVNIIAVIGIYFWFYRFTMNFGYLWWLLFAFIASFIVPKTIKYRLYNPVALVNSFSNDLIWISSIITNLFNGLFAFYEKHFLIKVVNGNLLNSLFNVFYFFKNSHRFIYIWEYNNTNYYILGSVNSQPFWLQKIKIQFLAFIRTLVNLKN